MRLPLLMTAAAPLILLAACASAPRSAPVGAANDLTSGSSSYGMFLAGESALANGKSTDAARFFDRARMETADPMIAERAFTAALLAGDIDKAAALAPTGDDASESAKRLGKLVVAVEAMADGKGKEARTLLANDSISFPHKPAAALLQPWAAPRRGMSRGRWSGPSCAATGWWNISASSARPPSMSAPSATTRRRPTSRR